jgi:dimethylargininase
LDRLFDFAFVRPPSNSYDRCVSSNPHRDEIDVNLAKEQHRQYCSILKESGIEIIELPALEGFPDSVFMQDPALLGSRRAVIGRFGEARRRGEEKALVEELRRYSQRIGKPSAIIEPGTLEGGDIVVTDVGLFVGESERTNPTGIQQLSIILNDVRVVALRTRSFHLLCGCAYLSNKTMLISPDLIDPKSFPSFKFITTSRDESYATDVLYLGDRRVLIPSGFEKTAMKLKESGYKPVEVEMSEFWKGDGGVTCLSSPVYTMI